MSRINCNIHSVEECLAMPLLKYNLVEAVVFSGDYSLFYFLSFHCV